MISDPKFPVILADPGWTYDDDGGRGAAANHYTCSSLLENATILDRFASDHAVLLMYAVWPMLRDCIRCAEFAGFDLVSLAFLWVKTTSGGLLHWGGGRAATRSNSEPVFLFRRGSKYPRRRAANVHQIVFAPYQGKHSAKPPEIRERIDALYGHRRRIELYARERTPGWSAWGNGVDELLRVLPPPEVSDAAE